MKPEEFEKMRVGGQFEYKGTTYTVKEAEVYGGKAHSLTVDHNLRVKVIDDQILPYMLLIRYSETELPAPPRVEVRFSSYTMGGILDALYGLNEEEEMHDRKPLITIEYKEDKEEFNCIVFMDYRKEEDE